MDYQLNIYPSSEIEMKNLKSENTHKHIKVVCENKLQTMYKKSFDAAVAEYNERVTSGKLIDNYLKSISESNIPELYRISLVLRYEPVKPEEVDAAQKVLNDFKKKLDEQEKLVIVSVFTTSQNEYKTMEVFFYPVCDGFITGLKVRSDLIGLVKQIEQMDSAKEINILQAMPLFVKYIESLFNEVNAGRFYSQEELEEIARKQDSNDPLVLHSIAIGSLKTQMNEMENLAHVTQEIEDEIEREKERIKREIVWVEEKTAEINKAEEARLERERQFELEKQRLREEERKREAQRREEERLREESRRIEAKRFAEQAKRNIEMHVQMQKQVIPELVIEERQVIDDIEKLQVLVDRHLKWQTVYGVTKETNYNKLSKAATSDPRRLNITGADLIGIDFSTFPPLVGISFKDCKFINCQFVVSLHSSSLQNCQFLNTAIKDASFVKCALSGNTMSKTRITNVTFFVTAIMKCDISNSFITKVNSKFKNNYTKCNFSQSQFEECNLQGSIFNDCDFTETHFINADCRDTSFESCKITDIQNVDSLFRGSNLEI